MRRFTTTSGSQYELSEDGWRIRRVGVDGNGKRGDGAWLHLHKRLPEADLTGMRLFLEIEPLVSLGPDDEGRLIKDAKVTLRTTTPVVADSWHPAVVTA